MEQRRQVYAVCASLTAVRNVGKSGGERGAPPLKGQGHRIWRDRLGVPPPARGRSTTLTSRSEGKVVGWGSREIAAVNPHPARFARRPPPKGGGIPRLLLYLPIHTSGKCRRPSLAICDSPACRGRYTSSVSRSSKSLHRAGRTDPHPLTGRAGVPGWSRRQSRRAHGPLPFGTPVARRVSFPRAGRQARPRHSRAGQAAAATRSAPRA
jgi:hypothetical protein